MCQAISLAVFHLLITGLDGLDGLGMFGAFCAQAAHVLVNSAILHVPTSIPGTKTA